jgi:hypothetical protein
MNGAPTEGAARCKPLRVNLSLTIFEHHCTSLLDYSRASCGTVNAFVPVVGILISPSSGVSDMSVDNVRPEANLLFAFTLTIAGTIAIGLPMTIAIIWVCS